MRYDVFMSRTADTSLALVITNYLNTQEEYQELHQICNEPEGTSHMLSTCLLAYKFT